MKSRLHVNCLGAAGLFGAAMIMACSQATATDVATVECVAVGRSPGMTGEQACGVIRARVAQALAAAKSARGTGVTVALDLSRPGSAIARVRHRQAGSEHCYPDIAVDVMDRRLVADDLARLADAVTQSILTELGNA